MRIFDCLSSKTKYHKLEDTISWEQSQKKELQSLFWKSVAKVVVLSVTATILTGLAIASAPVGGVVPFSIIAALLFTAAIGGVMECYKLNTELKHLA